MAREASSWKYRLQKVYTVGGNYKDIAKESAKKVEDSNEWIQAGPSLGMQKPSSEKSQLSKSNVGSASDVVKMGKTKGTRLCL